jgi:hypothetical protein
MAVVAALLEAMQAESKPINPLLHRINEGLKDLEAEARKVSDDATIPIKRWRRRSLLI